MRELAKVVKVTRKRAEQMKREPIARPRRPRHRRRDGPDTASTRPSSSTTRSAFDGIILTKLDGTAKGGIALAVASRLKLPIYRVGVGEQVEDLQEFDASDFAHALVGE